MSDIQPSSHHESTAGDCCKLSYILAVLVVVFADVAEVRRKGLDGQGTRDLPAFPLNDHTCREETNTCHKLRDSRERRSPFSPPTRLHLANNGGDKGEEKGALLPIDVFWLASLLFRPWRAALFNGPFSKQGFRL